MDADLSRGLYYVNAYLQQAKAILGRYVLSRFKSIMTKIQGPVKILLYWKGQILHITKSVTHELTCRYFQSKDIVMPMIFAVWNHLVSSAKHSSQRYILKIYEPLWYFFLLGAKCRFSNFQFNISLEIGTLEGSLCLRSSPWGMFFLPWLLQKRWCSRN